MFTCLIKFCLEDRINYQFRQNKLSLILNISYKFTNISMILFKINKLIKVILGKECIRKCVLNFTNCFPES